MQTLYFPDAYPLLFVSNAKAACTTVKRSIWRASSPDTLKPNSNVHNRREGPFADDLAAAARHVDGLPQIAKFSVVRNPYTRIISAYRNKVLRNLNTKAWKEMAERYGWPADKPIDLETLLVSLRDDDPYWIDPHFAKQTVNLSVDVINFAFICQLEAVDGLSAFLKPYEIPLVSHRAHQTGASEITDFTAVLSKREIDLVHEVFADDFKAFHYDMDPRRVEPIAPIEPQPRDETPLQILLTLASAQSGDEFAVAKQKLMTDAPELISHPLLQPDARA